MGKKLRQTFGVISIVAALNSLSFGPISIVFEFKRRDNIACVAQAFSTTCFAK